MRPLLEKWRLQSHSESMLKCFEYLSSCNWVLGVSKESHSGGFPSEKKPPEKEEKSLYSMVKKCEVNNKGIAT